MKEFYLSEMRKGMTFPEYRYTLRADIIETYLESIEEEDPLFTDEAYAVGGPFGQRIVPPTSIAIYVTPSRVLGTIDRVPPPGMIQSGQRFEFYNPVKVGETVTVHASISDVYLKKERYYVVLKAISWNEKGEKAAVSYLTFIWPS